MKIGLLTIATNKYTDFVNTLYESADRHFCNDHEVTYFLFTNKTDFVPQSKRNCEVFHIEHESWPMITLKRYHTFCRYKQELLKMDYVYYCDADMLFVNDVSDEIIGEKVVTLHPGFFNKPRNQFTYDTNYKSKAFISPMKGNRYYAGGFNGGRTEQFLNMSAHIMNNIDEDLKQGIVARWHDESHLNHYYNIITRPTIELSPSYCYPESWKLPMPKILLALDKNHKEYRV
jgi:histo-blood group ABO system transferase